MTQAAEASQKTKGAPGGRREEGAPFPDGDDVGSEGERRRARPGEPRAGIRVSGTVGSGIVSSGGGGGPRAADGHRQGREERPGRGGTRRSDGDGRRSPPRVVSGSGPLGCAGAGSGGDEGAIQGGGSEAGGEADVGFEAFKADLARLLPSLVAAPAASAGGRRKTRIGRPSPPGLPQARGRGAGLGLPRSIRGRGPAAPSPLACARPCCNLGAAAAASLPRPLSAAPGSSSRSPGSRPRPTAAPQPPPEAPSPAAAAEPGRCWEGGRCPAVGDPAFDPGLLLLS
jgi:hypothetical protein